MNMPDKGDISVPTLGLWIDMRYSADYGMKRVFRTSMGDKRP